MAKSTEALNGVLRNAGKAPEIAPTGVLVYVDQLKSRLPDSVTYGKGANVKLSRCG